MLVTLKVSVTGWQPPSRTVVESDDEVTNPDCEEEVETGMGMWVVKSPLVVVVSVWSEPELVIVLIAEGDCRVSVGVPKAHAGSAIA